MDVTTAIPSKQIIWCKGVSLGRVVWKINLDPSSRIHQNVVEPFPTHLVLPDCHPKVSDGHIFTECLMCWRQRSLCWCTNHTHTQCLASNFSVSQVIPPRHSEDLISLVAILLLLFTFIAQHRFHPSEPV